MTATPDIKPIETRYAGCRFRSRLEARWCVFLDALDIKWLYEPQGFTVGGKPYLPDFYLPEIDFWVEVKGDERGLDKDLLREFVTADNRILILGQIPDPWASGEWGWTLLYPEPVDHPDIYINGEYGWSTPPELQPIMGLTSFVHRRVCKFLWTFHPDNSGPWEPEMWTVPYLDRTSLNSTSDAYQAARSARFEHGECG